MLYSPFPYRVPWELKQKISTSVRNLGPLPRGESPLAAADTKDGDSFSGQTWGRRIQGEGLVTEPRDPGFLLLARDPRSPVSRLLGAISIALSQLSYLH